MDALLSLYETVRKPILIGEFLQMYDRLWPAIHEAGLTEDFRLGRGEPKRLRDEISPMALFAREECSDKDKILFPLDDGPLDCQIWHSSGNERKIQITLSQGRERFNLAQELNSFGEGRGFLGVPEHSSTANFRAAILEPRRMYCTQEAKGIFLGGLQHAIERKSDCKGNDTLIIGAPMETLGKDKWIETIPEMKGLAENSPFLEVYVVGTSGSDRLLLPIKRESQKR